jgi:hypothetical protein
MAMLNDWKRPIFLLRHLGFCSLHRRCLRVELGEDCNCMMEAICFSRIDDAIDYRPSNQVQTHPGALQSKSTLNARLSDES